MENSYFLQEHGINQIKVNKSKKKTVSLSTFFISLIMVAVLVILIFLKWDDIMWFFWVNTQEEGTDVVSWLSVWDEVAFSGSIRPDGDMENYTHTYLSDQYWYIWLKSKTIILNNYSDWVYFEWIVEKIYREMPIVLVTKIYNLDINEIENTWDISEDLTGESIDSQTVYLPNLWLYFNEDFLQKYSLVNEWDWSILKIKNLETSVIYPINYFKCSTSSSSENCERLNNLYSSSSSTKFVDKYGVSYYKDLEVNSRFFSNDLLFGYKINDADESFVRDMSTLLTVVNKNFVEKNILPKISSLCVVNHAGIEKVEKSELSYKNSDFYYIIDWLDNDKNKIHCELKIDPKLSNFAQIVSINLVEAENTETTWDVLSWLNDNSQNGNVENNAWNISKQEQQVYSRDVDVEQFPINLEKKITFTSSRGHSFIFPSSNIAYQWVSASEDFGQVGVNCFSAMNVVKYADKELVGTQWNVVIYECTVKNSFDDSNPTLIYKNIWDKHFVIQIIDPAWVDFANNIEIIA